MRKEKAGSFPRYISPHYATRTDVELGSKQTLLYCCFLRCSELDAAAALALGYCFYIYIFFRNKSEFYNSLRITKCHLSSGNNLLNSHRSGLQRPLGRLSHHESGYILNILNYTLLNLSTKLNFYSFDRIFREKVLTSLVQHISWRILIRRRWRVPRIRPAWQQIRPNHHATRLINPWAQSFSRLAHNSQKFLLLPASTFPKPWHIFFLLYAGP